MQDCSNMIVDFNKMTNEFKFKDMFERELKARNIEQFVKVTGSAVGDLYIEVSGDNTQDTVNKLKDIEGVKGIRCERRVKFKVDHKIVYSNAG